jgi:hypothetical protein
MPWTDVLIAALAGGAALFVWGAICWMVLPHHHGDFRPLPKADEEAMSSALAATRAGPGTYVVPHYANYAGMKDPAFADRYARGPNAMVTVTPPGPCMPGSTFAKGFLLDLLAAFAAAVVWRYAALSIGGAGKRLLFFAGVGALVHGFPTFQQVVWTKAPLRSAVTHLLDGIVGFVLLALVFEWLL